jgi:hypothetical protein
VCFQGVEGVTEDEVAAFGEEDVEEDEEFAMGSIEVRHPTTSS